MISPTVCCHVYLAAVLSPLSPASFLRVSLFNTVEIMAAISAGSFGLIIKASFPASSEASSLAAAQTSQTQNSARTGNLPLLFLKKSAIQRVRRMADAG